MAGVSPQWFIVSKYHHLITLPLFVELHHRTTILEIPCPANQGYRGGLDVAEGVEGSSVL